MRYRILCLCGFRNIAEITTVKVAIASRFPCRTGRCTSAIRSRSSGADLNRLTVLVSLVLNYCPPPGSGSVRSTHGFYFVLL
jgi:hypothetical protein